MKTNKLSSIKFLLTITLAVYLVATLLCSYTTKPAVTTGEFPFSITYEYNGEQNRSEIEKIFDRFYQGG